MSVLTRTRRRRYRRAALALPEETSESPLARVKPRPPAVGESWVDLIHHDPLVTVDSALLSASLRFAFESGDAGGLLGRAVDEAPTTPSRWDPNVFASGLFLEELIASCFWVEVEGRRYEPSRAHLVRLLAQPPDDARDVALRQAVLRELSAEPELRASLGRAYAGLRTLRTLLDERPMSAGETVRRKLEVLVTFDAFLREADEGLAGASSALRRLSEFARETRALEAYERLSQLIDFHDHLATVEVRLTLGSDGRIRRFDWLKVKENRDNPLVTSPWRRFWQRVVGFFRGYRFGEHEVLLELIDEVFLSLEPRVLPCFDLIGDIELYLAAFGFRDRARREGLEVCLPELVETPAIDAPAGPFAVKGLFNPLLLLQGVRPTPCDIESRGHDALVLVTGPNSGGKTRLLQALALTQLLAQNGLFVPAASARLTRAPTLFVSLVEGVPADQREGRLGTELTRVRQCFEQLEPGSMVILDELCSGTNPSEGVAIFEMVISLLPRLRPQVFLTTHFLDAASDLERRRFPERLELLQVELDGENEPTYQFVPGVAPTSLASQVASRLGVTHEQLEAIVERREARLEILEDPEAAAE